MNPTWLWRTSLLPVAAGTNRHHVVLTTSDVSWRSRVQNASPWLTSSSMCTFGRPSEVSFSVQKLPSSASASPLWVGLHWAEHLTVKLLKKQPVFAWPFDLTRPRFQGWGHGHLGPILLPPPGHAPKWRNMVYFLLQGLSNGDALENHGKRCLQRQNVGVLIRHFWDGPRNLSLWQAPSCFPDTQGPSPFLKNLLSVVLG